MSVQNHTYNINYPNMNFGQTILQGMFGSLTGCMGMNGSIFTPFGMGGCCGGSGMPMFGGFGVGVYSDQMIGMQIGSSIFNYGMMALGQYTQQRKAANATQAQNLDKALTTLDITNVNEYKPTIAFNSTEYDSSIISAIDSAIDSLPDSASTSPTHQIDEVMDDKGKVTGYKYNGETYKTKADAEAAYKADKLNYDKYNALKNAKASISSLSSDNIDSKLIPNSVKNAVIEKEKAIAEFDEAKQLVKEAYQRELAQDATSSVKSLSKNQRKNATISPLITAYKAAQKNKNSQTLATLKDEYNKFKNNDDINNFKEYSGSITSIANWYNSVSESDKLDLINFS